jgi:WD40 repeat protein
MKLKKNFKLPSNILVEKINGKIFWHSKQSVKLRPKLISASADMTIGLWDTNTDAYVKEFDNRVNSIESLIRISKNEIAFGSDDRKIRIWNIETHRLVTTLVGHNSSVKSLLMLNSGQLASGSHKTIKIWNLDLPQATCIRTMNGHTRTVLCLAQSTYNNDELVSGSWDSTIKIWNITLGVCLRTLIGHTNSIMCISFVNDAIISGSYDSTIKLWNSYSNVRTFKGHSLSVASLVVLNTYTNLVISGSIDKTLKMWDFRLGSCLKTFQQSHTNIVSSLVMLPTGELFSGSFDETIKKWNLNNGRCSKELKTKFSINNLTFYCPIN